MSPRSKILRLVVVLAIFGVGAFLLMQSGSLAPESAARQDAVRMALAPGGVQSGSAGPLQQAAVSPVVVDLNDIPAGVYDPNNQYDRWQRGELDLDENESMVSEAEKAALQEEAKRLPASRQLSIDQAVVSQASLAAGSAFDSIDYTECCGGGGNVPPDPELAVGPNHVIAVVNVAFEIYDKSGTTQVGPTTFASFMNGDPNCTGVFDPNVLYDESADRFLLGIDADGDHYCLAASQTGDPTGSWNLYSFQTASTIDFFDYPHAGVGRDAIYMGSNIFGAIGFKESRVYAFDKAAMYAGQAASYVTRSLPTSEDTPQPLNLHGWNQGTWPNSGPHYFFTETDYNGAEYSVFSWNDPFGANTWIDVGTVNLASSTGVAAGYPVDTLQNGGQTLQANDYRPQDFEYRNGYAWSSMTISCNPGGGTVNCVRWAQIDPAAAIVVDSGVYASNGEYRTFPDLAVNHCDDMVIGYTKSSTSMYPGIYVAGRESGDVAGTLQAETQLKAGEIAYTSFESSAPRRWGDYTEMTIAPDGMTFWYLGEYSKDTGTTNGHWGTYIGSYTFPNCSVNPPPTPTPVPSVNMHVGDLDASVTTNRNNWNATTTITILDVNSIPVSNATVYGTWSNGATGSNSCETDESGQCSITRNSIKKNVSVVTFTVDNVTNASNSYASGDNSDPDGDSDGTTILVYKDTPPDPTPTPGPTTTPGPGVAMHIGDLDGSSASAPRNRWNATVMVTVHDSNDSPVANALVEGNWSDGANGGDSCTTNGSGQCDIIKTNIKSNASSATFTVNNVSSGNNTYISGANHDPDGDSNGTTITVGQP